MAAAAASRFLLPPQCLSAFLRAPRGGWQQESSLLRMRRSQIPRRKVNAERPGAGKSGGQWVLCCGVAVVLWLQLGLCT